MSLQQYAAQVFYATTYAAPTKPKATRAPRVKKVAAVQPPDQALAASPSVPAAATGKAATPIAPPAGQPTTSTTPAKAVTPATPVAAGPPAATAPAAATSDIAPESSCPGQSSTANVASVISCMTAYARLQHGVAGISSNSTLVSAAVAKDQDMLDCGYSHTACDRPFNYWFSAKGYMGNCAAENIAQGQRSSGEVFTAWMNSAAHRTNILNGSYQDVGVAVVPSSSGNLWVMELGGC